MKIRIREKMFGEVNRREERHQWVLKVQLILKATVPLLFTLQLQLSSSYSLFCIDLLERPIFLTQLDGVAVVIITGVDTGE